MSDVTRRELFGLAAVGALGITASGCAARMTSAAGTGVLSAKFDMKIAIQGLTVIHRDFDSANVITRIRLAAIDPTKNRALGLMAHAPLLGIPHKILTAWPEDLPPVVSTMDYMFWNIKGWKATIEVTSNGTTHRVGGTTKLDENREPADPTTCGGARTKWANANMLVSFRDVMSSPQLAGNWQNSEFIAGYIELPFGTLEHKSLKDGPHEKFDERTWYLGKDGQPKAGKVRALKNVARVLLSDLESAKVVTSVGDIQLKAPTMMGYDPRSLPVIISNLSIATHSMGAKTDFKAYYDILQNPPAIADRHYPTEENACATSVECGCCPPLAT